jgi:hypothetical protein
MKLLKQKSSGEIYVWTELLAKRDDMEPYERPVVAPAVPEVVASPEPVQAEPADESIKQMAQAVLKRRKK